MKKVSRLFFAYMFSFTALGFNYKSNADSDVLDQKRMSQALKIDVNELKFSEEDKIVLKLIIRGLNINQKKIQSISLVADKNLYFFTSPIVGLASLLASGGAFIVTLNLGSGGETLKYVPYWGVAFIGLALTGAIILSIKKDEYMRSLESLSKDELMAEYKKVNSETLQLVNEMDKLLIKYTKGKFI